MHLPLDHVAIAVESIAASLPTYESLLGASGSPVEHIASQGVSVTFVGTGPGRIELLQPTGPDTTVGRFLARRGPGLHHIAYRVPDIEAALAWSSSTQSRAMARMGTALHSCIRAARAAC